MAMVKSSRSRQPQIRIVPVWREEIDLDRLARVLEIAKQLADKELERKRFIAKRPSRARHATSLHRRGRSSETHTVAETRPDSELAMPYVMLGCPRITCRRCASLWI